MRLCVLLGFLLTGVSLAHGATVDGPMTIEAYADTPHDTPYVLSLSKGRGRLLYVGIAHSLEAKSQTIKTVQKLWKSENPDVVLIEGIFPPPAKSLDEAIRFYGEAGATAFLARQRGTSLASLELPFEEEVAVLLKEFTPEQVALFYTLRLAAQQRENHGPDTLTEYLSGRIIPWLARNAALKQIIVSEDSLKSLVAKRLPELSYWQEVPAIWFDPMPQSGARFTNSIARRLVQLRDGHMSKLVIDPVDRGRHVFAVVGVSHVVMQEDQIRSVLGCPARVDVSYSVRQSPPHLTCSVPRS